MEAHEASSLYSEKKAQMLRHIGNLVENKDKELAEFITSLQLDVLSEVKHYFSFISKVVILIIVSDAQDIWLTSGHNRSCC